MWDYDTDNIVTFNIHKDTKLPSDMRFRISSFQNDLLCHMKQLQNEFNTWYLIYIRNKPIISLDIFRLVWNKYLKRKPIKGCYIKMVKRNLLQKREESVINYCQVL